MVYYSKVKRCKVWNSGETIYKLLGVLSQWKHINMLKSPTNNVWHTWKMLPPGEAHPSLNVQGFYSFWWGVVQSHRHAAPL